MTAPHNPAEDLPGQARSLLHRVMTFYRDDPRIVGQLRTRLERLSQPLQIAVSGRVKSGKSTLINALLGEDLAPTDTAERTQVNTFYRYGPEPRISVHTPHGAVQQIPSVAVDASTIRDLQRWRPDEVARLVIETPSPGLQAVTLVETPGVASAGTKDTGRSARAQILSEADALLYLTRHTHQTDIQFLQSLHEQHVARYAPVSTIVVLSRADEIGSGRQEAMASAARIADRYRDDPRVRSFAQFVIPVSGALGHAAQTMRDQDFATVAALAALPRQELEELTISAERLINRDVSTGITQQARRELVARLGLYGVGHALEAPANDTGDAKKLAGALLEESRLNSLHEAVHQQFIERQGTLRARSMLMAVDLVMRAHPRPGVEGLRGELERLLANAHEFEELRVLSAMRSGQLAFAPEVAAEAERLLGAFGADTRSRLGAGSHASDRELVDLAGEVLAHWRGEAGNPLYDGNHREAARTVLRSCERLIADQVLT